MSTMLSPTSTAPAAPPAHATVEIEYWTVEMQSDSCGACDSALVALQDARELVHGIVDELGLRIEIVERSIRSWTQALEHSIAASPTIRSEGLELRPDHDGLTEARTWRWRGDTSAGPSHGQLVEFLLSAVASRSRRLEEYLQAGSASPYLEQYLQPGSLEAQDDDPEPAGTCCG